MGLFKASLLLTLLAVSIGQTLGTCGKCRQSPINIVTAQLVSAHMAPIQFNDGYFVDPDNINLSVDDVTITFTVDHSIAPAISGGPLKTDYVLHSIHFHWGSDNSKGSEHTIDGRAYPMEMHAVHVKNGMDIGEAKKLPDGISVIGYVVEISPTRFLKNDANVAFFQLLAENFASLENIKDEISLPRVLSLNHIIVPFDQGYVTYNGSLTTPKYDEAVIWLVAPLPLHITQGQLNAFRGLLDQGLITSNDNWRKTQPLNGRTVLRADYHNIKNSVMDEENYNFYDNHLDDYLGHEEEP